LTTTTGPAASESKKRGGAFQISRAGDTSRPLTVFYTLSGSAKNGIDYRRLPGKITFRAGSSTATIGVKPIDDHAREKLEKVKVKLAGSAAYRLGLPRRSVVTIEDND
jgi:hypothetical protein